jgi:hypothetical protein
LYHGQRRRTRSQDSPGGELWLFTGSDRGQSATAMYSLIIRCELNDVYLGPDLLTSSPASPSTATRLQPRMEGALEKLPAPAAGDAFKHFFQQVIFRAWPIWVMGLERFKRSVFPSGREGPHSSMNPGMLNVCSRSPAFHRGIHGGNSMMRVLSTFLTVGIFTLTLLPSDASAYCTRSRYWSGTEWRFKRTCSGEQMPDRQARHGLWCTKPGYIQCASTRCPDDLNACSYRCLCE